MEIDESAQPVQICAQAGKPVISVAKKDWFADDVYRNIEDLPILLERVGELIYRRTGFVVTYLCAGPNPQNDWKISATRLE